MSHMTDFIYTSPVADLGYGRRQETINKEVIEYPAPNNYDQTLSKKQIDHHKQQRKRITVREPLPVERAARRKKDRTEKLDSRSRGAPAIIHPGQEEPPNGSEFDPLSQQNVYTLGMEERDKRKVIEGPGPGSHNIKSTIGSGPKYLIGGAEKDTKIDRDQAGPNSFNIVLKSRAPKYSFGTRSGVGLGYGPPGQFKSLKPGPGAYELKDEQFKKPCTKFSKAAKQTLLKQQGPPPSKTFNPKPVDLEADKYSFPLARRLEDPIRDNNMRSPGPGEYMVEDKLSKGQAKSMLGGSTAPQKIKDNDVPGPGNYFQEGDANEYLYHIPGVKIVSKPDRFKFKKDEEGDINKDALDDGKPQKLNQPAFSIGKGLREPIKNKFNTPGPNYYFKEDDKDDKNKDKKFHFHMGMRTNYKSNRGQDMPGPAEYHPDIYQPITHAHFIGTSHRSDLGVGKAYLQPGPGDYETRGKFDGPQIKFGNEAKNTKIKKTYEPGPANYDLPGTVGNIPKYLRLKQEREMLDRIDDKSDNMEILQS